MFKVKLYPIVVKSKKGRYLFGLEWDLVLLERGGWVELPRLSNYYFCEKNASILAAGLILLYYKSKCFAEFESFNVKHLRPRWREAISHFELQWRWMRTVEAEKKKMMNFLKKFNALFFNKIFALRWSWEENIFKNSFNALFIKKSLLSIKDEWGRWKLRREKKLVNILKIIQPACFGAGCYIEMATSYH